MAVLPGLIDGLFGTFYTTHVALSGTLIKPRYVEDAIQTQQATRVVVRRKVLCRALGILERSLKA